MFSIATDFEKITNERKEIREKEDYVYIKKQLIKLKNILEKAETEHIQNVKNENADELSGKK